MVFCMFLLSFLIIFQRTFCQPFDIEILDKCSPNTVVLDLDKIINPHQTMDKMKYTLSKIDDESKFFTIKDDKVFTTSVIDIDSMCSDISKCCNKDVDFCDLKITILYSNARHSATNKRILQVHIRDINDHTPKFRNPTMEIELSESKKEPYFVELPLAYDEDFGRNRIEKYQMGTKEPSSFDEFFSLVVNGDRNIPSSVSLRLNKMLDRETISKFSFELLAIDGNLNMRKTGTILVIIKVMDENDNIPLFQKSTYKEVIREGVFNNRPIVTLLATDSDDGDNAKISYLLSSNFINDISINDNFRVESNGKIFLKKALDYEKKSSYRFTVIATNPTPFANNRAGISTATVEVEVENVNDEPLKIIIDYPTGKNFSQVPENIADYEVAYVTAKSTESGQKYVSINCLLQSYEALFELIPKNNNDINTKSYEIRTKTGIDRESHPKIETNVVCKESNSPNGKSSEKVLVVIVQDENDNIPELRIEGETKVMENEMVGKVIFTVKVIDPDEGENGRVTFSLDKSDPSSLEYLKIGETDGKVRVKSNIDCEAQNVALTFFDLMVTASDNGRPPKSSDLKLRVHVQDVNDNKPIFRTNPLEFTVTENDPKYTFIGDIEVTDADHTDKVSLRIRKNNQLSLPFIITTKDNRVFYLNTTRSIDREKDASFTFEVVATDGTGHNAHSVTATVDVKVMDVNDNAPIIIFPTQNNASVHRLSYLEPPNYKLILVSANDNDQFPENNKLDYSVEDAAKIFGITNEDKFIITQREMTKADIGDHILKIIVRDCGIPRQETSITINVVIDQSNPKSSSYNNRNHITNGDRSLDKSFPGNFDLTLCVIIVIIILILIIVIVVFIYVIRRCRKEDSCPCYELLTCFRSPESSPTVSKSMISSPTSKFNYQDEKQIYNNHQLTILNNEHLLEENQFGEPWTHDRNRMQQYNMVTNPYMTSKATYTKLSNSPQGVYQSTPYQHVYQTIEDRQLAQRQMDQSMKRMPSFQSKGKSGEHYKSEVNLNRWNSLGNECNEFFPSNTSTGAPWVTSQTPLPTRSRNVANNALQADSEDNFAVAFPQEQSTFV